MPISYISTEQKNYINLLFDNVHETFSREITIVATPEVTVIAPSATFNSFYGNDTPYAANSKTYSGQTYTYKAKIKYLSQNEVSVPGTDSQQKTAFSSASVKIKVPAAAKDHVANSKRIEFEGRKYRVVSDQKPHGLFGPRYYSFILVVDE